MTSNPVLIDDSGPTEPSIVAIAPGATHLVGWLDITLQQQLVKAFRSWATSPVPLRAAALPNGHRMSVETVCLGWHWQPYKYTRHASDVNGKQVSPLPEWLADLARCAVADAYDAEAAAEYGPDAALVNYYRHDARLGMHQDKDERSDQPVVSFSVGDSCSFRFGNTSNRAKPYSDIRLNSGDVFVFGRESRFAYHGVPKIYPDTGPPGSALGPGRLNVTLRVTGLA
jgi:DNA oxidative demethylase